MPSVRYSYSPSPRDAPNTRRSLAADIARHLADPRRRRRRTHRRQRHRALHRHAHSARRTFVEQSTSERRQLGAASPSTRRARAEHSSNTRRHTSAHADDCVKRARVAAHRSIPLAIRRTLSHNRDEFKNSEQRRRACDAQALSNSEDGGAERAAMAVTSQTPRRQLTRFEARFFCAARQARFRTRLSAHIAPRCRKRASANGHAYVKWRA